MEGPCRCRGPGTRLAHACDAPAAGSHAVVGRRGSRRRHPGRRGLGAEQRRGDQRGRGGRGAERAAAQHGSAQPLPRVLSEGGAAVHHPGQGEAHTRVAAAWGGGDACLWGVTCVCGV